MLGRISGYAGFILASAAEATTVARTVASSCVSAVAGRAVAQVNCDDDISVSAGHLGGAFVTIVDDDPVASLAAKHPAPVPIAHKPAKLDKPDKPSDSDKAPDRGEVDPGDGDPGDGNPNNGGGGDGGGGGQDDVSVELDCDASPETTRVTNNTSDPITVNEINPTSAEPIPRDDEIAPGDSITYQSGTDARGRFDVGGELYDDDDEDAQVRLSTSGGDFDGFCFAS
jgi:hypothetical protein